MKDGIKRRRHQKILFLVGSVLTVVILFLFLFVNSLIEPVLRKKLHTLIINGSDSLYSYTLGKIKANFYGGNVEVENLQITVDSVRYAYLSSRNALPSLTMQLSLKKGHIKGVNLFALLFSKKIKIHEILSSEADIKLSRHVRPSNVEDEAVPLWKAIQPSIKSIAIGKIKLDGVKLLYRHADTSASIKLQFDRCEADFENVMIDSTTSNDTTRIGFSKEIFMRFHDLKFRTTDSSYKMKAEWITYSSKAKTLLIDSFKLQPTLEKEDYYRKTGKQNSLYYIEFAKVRFVNTQLDLFIHNDIIKADSVVFEKPHISIYTDKSVPLPDFESKIGRFPHQQLLKAATGIMIKNIIVSNANVQYTEKNAKTLKEGVLRFRQVNLKINNITNSPALIRQNAVCTAQMEGNIIDSSPFTIAFRFYLDSANGSYDAKGWVKNISSAQLNSLTIPMASVDVNSFKIHNLDFNIRGEDNEANGDVGLRYNDLAVRIFETNQETGISTTKKFITKLVNKFVLWSDNPGSDGVERISGNTRVLRLSMHSFFGQLWKTIFAGMQNIMMKSGKL